MRASTRHHSGRGIRVQYTRDMHKKIPSQHIRANASCADVHGSLSSGIGSPDLHGQPTRRATRSSSIRLSCCRFAAGRPTRWPCASWHAPSPAAEASGCHGLEQARQQSAAGVRPRRCAEASCGMARTMMGPATCLTTKLYCESGNAEGKWHCDNPGGPCKRIGQRQRTRP